jgi:hypothetical protein
VVCLDLLGSDLDWLSDFNWGWGSFFNWDWGWDSNLWGSDLWGSNLLDSNLSFWGWGSVFKGSESEGTGTNWDGSLEDWGSSEDSWGWGKSKGSWGWGKSKWSWGKSKWSWGWSESKWSWGWGESNWSWGKDTGSSGNDPLSWGWGNSNDSWSWGIVSWSEGLSWENSFTFVFHISNITGLISVVGDNLDTAVGKVDSVFSSGIVVVAVLVVREGLTGLSISNTVLEVIVGGNNGFLNKEGSWAIGWGRGSIILGHGGGASQQSCRKGKLKRKINEN